MQVLIAGLGSIGLRQAGLLSERDDVELLSYRTGNGPPVPADLDIRTYRELNDALATDPDVAFVTNPTNKHVDVAQKCAKQGCDLFVEKPLSHDFTGTSELGKIAEEQDLVTMVGCQFRFDPVIKRVRNIVSTEEFGPIQSFRAYSGSYLPDWRPDRDYKSTYSAHSDRGGGVVLDLIHEIDYLYWFFGLPERVSASLSSVPGLDIDSESVAEILMTVEENVPGSVHLDYCRPVPRRSLELNCEDAVITGDVRKSSIKIETQEGTESEEFDVERDDRFRAQTDYFLEKVREREECQNDIRTAKEVLGIALEIKSETPYE